MLVIFDIDGVIRDVAGSYRRALADTVEQFTQGVYRPSPIEIDALKSEGLWNNDWEASQELVYRYFEAQGVARADAVLDYDAIVAFFQSRYRGDLLNGYWTGYISQEPLLVNAAYFDNLTAAGFRWGFFSGATRISATFVLEQRIGLRSPLLVAMEDAPGKPDPIGLFTTMEKLMAQPTTPVVYVGDTVADMQTIERSRQLQPSRSWFAVGVLPPHVLNSSQADAYRQTLRQAGADLVLDGVQELLPPVLQTLG
jgi:HAD superfamily phosphatase